jgi:hypothetical protein
MFRNLVLFIGLTIILGSCSSNSSRSQNPPSDDLDVAVVPGGPAIFFVDVNVGPKTGGPNNAGVPIAIFGKGFGASRGTSTVTIGGIEVARYVVWGQNNAHNTQLDMIVVQPGANVVSGPIQVKVNNRLSNINHSFTVNTGKIYAVSKTGSNSNVCTLSSPCATILHVIDNHMQPGDTLLVRRGNYDESEIWVRKSGTAGNPITIKHFPGEEVTLSNPARGFLLDADYITVSGFNFTNGKSLAITGWAKRYQRNNKAINNTFKGLISYAALDSHGNNHLIAGNVCEVDGSTQGTQGHCYYISYGRNVRVIYNKGSGVPGYGIHVFDQCRVYEPDPANPDERICDIEKDFQRIINNLLIEGNLLMNSSQRSGMLIGMNDEGNLNNYIDNITIRNNLFVDNNHAGIALGGISQNIKIYHNTFYQNGRQGIQIYNDNNISGVDIRNNLIDQTTNNNCQIFCSWYQEAHIQKGLNSQNVIVDHNFYMPAPPILIDTQDANPSSGNANFVNAGSLDFHLQASSPAINQGTVVPVNRDFDGQRRPAGSTHDPGAFEFR